MNNLSVFNFNSNQVRIVIINGQPWFVAKDVLTAIGSSTTVTALKALVSEDLGKEFVIVLPLPTAGGKHEMMLLSEPALLLFLGRTRTTAGKQMNQWVLTKMLPAVRKSTYYDFGQCPDKDRSGFIYLAITSNGWCKIGMSKQPYRRMSSLQTGTPLEITLVHRVFTFDTGALEKALHDYYAAYWLRGEWFDLPDECIGEFPAIANELDTKLEQVCLPSK